MVTYPYKWKILQWDQNSKNKQTNTLIVAKDCNNQHNINKHTKLNICLLLLLSKIVISYILNLLSWCNTKLQCDTNITHKKGSYPLRHILLPFYSGTFQYLCRRYYNVDCTVVLMIIFDIQIQWQVLKIRVPTEFSGQSDRRPVTYSHGWHKCICLQMFVQVACEIYII